MVPGKSQLLLATITPLSLAYGLNTVLMFLSPVVDVHPNFLTLISTMLVVLSTLAKLITHPKSPESSKTSTKQASPLRLYVWDSRRLVGKLWSRKKGPCSAGITRKREWILH